MKRIIYKKDINNNILNINKIQIQYMIYSRLINI